MNETVQKAIKRLLRHSFDDIDFGYDGLTATEKKLVTREEFDAIVAWAKED